MQKKPEVKQINLMRGAYMKIFFSMLFSMILLSCSNSDVIDKNKTKDTKFSSEEQNMIRDKTQSNFRGLTTKKPESSNPLGSSVQEKPEDTID